MRSSLFLTLVFVISMVVAQPLTGTFDATNSVGVDRISATSARVRFLPPQQLSVIDRILIQLTNNTNKFSLTRTEYHNCIVFTSGVTCNPALGLGDYEFNITQGTFPITSFILRNLQPSTRYLVRAAYLDKSTPQQVVGSALIQAVDFSTIALSPSTNVGSLIASGGCGSLTNNVLTYLSSELLAPVGTTAPPTTPAPTGVAPTITPVVPTSPPIPFAPINEDGPGTQTGAAAVPTASTRVYTCTVVSTVSNVTLSLTTDNAYSSIEAAEGSSLTATNGTLSVTSTQVDPRRAYNTTIQLGSVGTTTNYSFIVTAENGNQLNYKLVVIRTLPSPAAELTGPSSPVVALIKSPSRATSFIYRALLFQGASVSGAANWKVWSDDLVAFPFTAFNITFPSASNNDYTLASVNVSPSAATGAGVCSPIFVGLFDQLGRSQTLATCVAAINDICSPTPFGAATTWQSFTNAQGRVVSEELYHPAPPTPTFPRA